MPRPGAFGATKFRNAVPAVPPRDAWYRSHLPSADQSATNTSVFSSSIKTNRHGILTLTPGGDCSSRGYSATDAQEADVWSGKLGTVTDWDLSALEDGGMATAGTDVVSYYAVNGSIELRHSIKVGTKTSTVVLHPSTPGLLLSASASPAIYDFASGASEAALNLTTPDPLWSAAWSVDGRLVGGVSKNGMGLVWDARAGPDPVHSKALSFLQPLKPVRVTWVDDEVFITSFSRTRTRQYSLLSADLTTKFTTPVDTSMAPLLPVVDQERRIVYLAGKGDMTLRQIELSGPQGYQEMPHSLPSPLTSGSIALAHWSTLPVMEAQVANLLLPVMDKDGDAIMPLAIKVPRRQLIDYHADLYPDVSSGVPEQTGAEWLKGEDRRPLPASLDPERRGEWERTIDGAKGKWDISGAGSAGHTQQSLPPAQPASAPVSDTSLSAATGKTVAAVTKASETVAPPPQSATIAGKNSTTTLPAAEAVGVSTPTTGEETTTATVPAVEVVGVSTPTPQVSMDSVTNEVRNESTTPFVTAPSSPSHHAVSEPKEGVPPVPPLPAAETAKSEGAQHTEREQATSSLSSVLSAEKTAIAPTTVESSRNDTKTSAAEPAPEPNSAPAPPAKPASQTQPQAQPAATPSQAPVSAASATGDSRQTDQPYNPTWSRKYMAGKSPLIPTYDQIPSLATLHQDSSVLRLSAHHALFPIDGPGGRICVQPLSRKGRVPVGGIGYLSGGVGVADFAADPFSDRVVLAGEDGVLRIWQVGPEGIEGPGPEPEHVLRGDHLEKVAQLAFHPTAKDLLTVVTNELGKGHLRFFDLSAGAEVRKVELGSQAAGLAWNNDGDRVAVATKDQQIMVLDWSGIIAKGKAHDSPRSAQVCWAGDHLVSLGFSRGSMRKLNLYSVHGSEITTIASSSIDVSPSVLFPHYDPDTSILYVWGKGQQAVHAFEVHPDANEPLAKLPSFTAGSPQIAIAFFPKTAVDVKKVEIAKALRLTARTIEEVSFTIPRNKPQFFQNDIYVPTLDGVAVTTAAKWLEGDDTKPCRVDLRPADMDLLSNAPAPAAAAKRFVPAADVFSEEEKKKREMDAMFQRAQNLDSDSDDEPARSGLPPPDDDW